jgi:hypothetical protein
VGSAFVIMWHDIATEGESEYHHWHSKEHMPERLSHPGFLRSRRGVNWSYGRQRYFTLYEGEALDTFLSAEYARSLNGPTEWTSRMAPHFRHFLRSACEVVYSAGRGVGGALCTIRGDLPGDEGDGAREALLLDRLLPGLERLVEDPRVCGVHLAMPRPDFSAVRTRETDLRPPMDERGFEFVLIVESYGLREMETVMPAAAELLEDAGAANLLTQAYDTAYVLDEKD